jgi:hypothetical protein
MTYSETGVIYNTMYEQYKQLGYAVGLQSASLMRLYSHTLSVYIAMAEKLHMFDQLDTQTTNALYYEGMEEGKTDYLRFFADKAA